MWTDTSATDRVTRTTAARASFERSFVLAAGGDVVKADELRRLHYRRLALKSGGDRMRARLDADHERAVAWVLAQAEAEAPASDVGGDAA